MVAVPSTMLPLGTRVPAFRLPDAHGRMHGTADVADTAGLLVVFVCNHCPFVIHIAPTLGRLTRRWMDRGLAVLAVNANDVDAYPADGPGHMPAFARRNDWTFPYLLDETQQIARAFRAACTPDLFLFDAEHRLVYRGQFDASRPDSGVPATGDDLDRAVQAVLTGEPVFGDQIPSTGCNIKWRPGCEPEYAPG